MSKTQRHIAIDLGAASGRVFEVCVDTAAARTRELHRFDNGPIAMPDGGGERWCWDVLALWRGVLRGLQIAAAKGPVESIGVDAWAVDYALLDGGGRLAAPVTAYRDARHRPFFDLVRQRIGVERMYDLTGIQLLPFNTIYQLAADAADPHRPLDRAERFLMIPDLIAFWLCGSTVTEHTNASTTQLYETTRGLWIDELVQAIGVPPSLLPSAVAPGTPLGTLRHSVAAQSGLPANTPVLAVGSHDTASAIAAAPLSGSGDAYISSGTWSLVGVELDSPIRTRGALVAGFTNEAGVFGTTRLLRNVAGLWLLQECRRQWQAAGHQIDWNDLASAAANARPFASIIDPDDPVFSHPGDMCERIRRACRASGEPIPECERSMTRCILDSLTLRYDQTLRDAARVSGRRIERLVIVGGGAANQTLNQLAANMTGLPVVVGPTEAAALGNGLLQHAAMVDAVSLPELRQLTSDSAPHVIEPDHSFDDDHRDEARARFHDISTNLEGRT